LQQAINDLPQKLKEALILFSIEERSQKEVAELLETTPKTVELRVYRARTRLREALGGNALSD
jgi:RNA polymerase sigma factor (sigma-70 family)